jgi:hypothetical protein
MTDFLLIYDARAEPLLRLEDFAMVPVAIAAVAVFLFRRYMPTPPTAGPSGWTGPPRSSPWWRLPYLRAAG